MATTVYEREIAAPTSPYPVFKHLELFSKVRNILVNLQDTDKVSNFNSENNSLIFDVLFLFFSFDLGELMRTDG